MTAAGGRAPDEATVADLGLQPSRPQGASASATIREVVGLEASERSGRYLPIEELGRGGMGRVLRAYDTKLQREVALKVLAAEHIDARARARMVREARTMARLNHPNVVAVYDVEDEPRHGIVLAMELVVGSTLSRWLAEARRPWDEILAALVEAGRGLAAAHGEGLLHRDFKPANVLVALGVPAGPRGLVKVTDFGLAKDDRDDATAQSGDAGAPAADDVTEVGVVMGTPAYMAPEQYRGQPLTAAVDQYAFCVSLWEALYGERPLQGATREELRANVLAGKRRPAPAGAVVPGWLRQACERGLSLRPEDRWPSMDALLAALGQGRARARRRLGLAAAGVLLMIAGGLETSRQWSIAQRTAACEAEGDEIAQAWSDAQRQSVHAALVATGAGHAETTSTKLMPWLDRQVAAWREARVEACLAATVEERWSADLLARSRWCLDERRTELESLVQELSRADARTVDMAVPAAAGLASVEPCRDRDALEALGVPPSEQHDAVRAVRDDVARAVTLERAGRYEEGLALARTALERAGSLEWRPLSAMARARVGRLLEHAGAYADAEAMLEDAYFEAADGVAPEVAVEAAAELVYLLGNKLARPVEAQRWGRHAELALAGVHDPEGRALLLRGLAVVHYHTGAFDQAKALGEELVALQEQVLGRDHPDLATSLNNLAGAQWASGAYDEAKALCERALAIRERALGPDHPDVAKSLANIGKLQSTTGDVAGAKASFERSLAIEERVLGPRHPDIALALADLGNVYAQTGEPARAEALFVRALAISEAALGPKHLHVAVSLNNLAHVRNARGDHPGARALLERSLAILEVALGPEHPDVVSGLENLAEAHRQAGELQPAKALHERALAIAGKTLGPEHPQLGLVLHNSGRVLVELGEHQAAQARFERALAIREKVLGPEHPELADTIAGLADVALAGGRTDDAMRLGSRAVAIHERSGSSPLGLAAARFVLARASWAVGKTGADRARARSLAEQAREAYRTQGRARELGLVEQWLAEHEATP